MLKVQNMNFRKKISTKHFLWSALIKSGQHTRTHTTVYWCVDTFCDSKDEFGGQTMGYSSPKQTIMRRRDNHSTERCAAQFLHVFLRLRFYEWRDMRLQLGQGIFCASSMPRCRAKMFIARATKKTSSSRCLLDLSHYKATIKITINNIYCMFIVVFSRYSSFIDPCKPLYIYSNYYKRL